MHVLSQSWIIYMHVYIKVDTYIVYHHLQKFKTTFQNPTTQWKKQSWKNVLFKNIYFQQITILYDTLPHLWYEMVTVSYLVCPLLFLMYVKIIEIPTNSQVVLNFCKWWYIHVRVWVNVRLYICDVLLKLLI